MLPEFPKFKNLDLHDRTDIEAFTKLFPPYSDFNFISMFSWDIKGVLAVSVLNQNLVVKFSDYVTGVPFYSFLGMNNVNQTAKELILFAKKNKTYPKLRLVGEQVASNLNSKELQVTVDPDNHDYILSVPEMITFEGNRFRGKRNFVNRFKKQYTSVTRILALSETETKEKIKELFFLWGVHKNLRPADFDSEFIAITRLLDSIGTINPLAVGVFVDDQLIGFSINEVIDHQYAVLHFEKADVSKYTGIYPYLMQETARAVSEHGCLLINYEQDLGIEGLKRCKKSYSPTTLLKKYVVSLKEDYGTL